MEGKNHRERRDLDEPHAAAPAEAPATAAPPAQPTKRRRLLRHPIVLIILAVLVSIGVVLALLYLAKRMSFETTDDAFVDVHVVPIAPQVSGPVLQVPVDDNQLVRTGQLLVKIDPRDYEAQLALAEAALASARAKREVAQTDFATAQAQLVSAQEVAGQTRSQAAAAEADANRAQADAARARNLRTNNVISAEEFDRFQTTSRTATANFRAAQSAVSAQTARVLQASNQVNSAQANVAVAVAGIGQAQADVTKAQLNLSYTTIEASQAGFVTRKSVAPGAYVQAGQRLMAIVPEQVWVVANYKETQLRLMRPGQPAELRVDAYPHTRYTGKVDSIQAGSGAFFSLLPPENAVGNYVKVVQRVPVKILFEQRDLHHLLGPGMSVVPRVKVENYRYPIWVWAVVGAVLVGGFAWLWKRRRNANEQTPSPKQGEPK